MSSEKGRLLGRSAASQGVVICVLPWVPSLYNVLASVLPGQPLLLELEREAVAGH